MFTQVSAIYADEINRNIHIGVEANFKGGGWGLTIIEKEWAVPAFQDLDFDASTIAFFVKGFQGGIFSKRANRGTMLMLLNVNGTQLRRHIFQTEGIMTPVVISPYHYKSFYKPIDKMQIVLQYQGEGDCNFEYHVTMGY